MRTRAMLASLGMAVGIVLAPIATPRVAADDAPVATPAVGPVALRAPVAVLRSVEAARSSIAPTIAGDRSKQAVVLVGGYQSCACDSTFDALTRDLIAQGFEVKRFGADPRYPYDTYGNVEANAIHLRDEVRAIARDHAGVHIVTHSMGGVVADRAFANGLSAADGVISYVSWSAPHAGSDAARAIQAVDALSPGTAGLRDGLLWLGMEPDSPAVRDLARARPVPRPSGVVRLDLREATDVLVTARDSRDPGVASLTLTGALEGHGGILTDPAAIDLTVRTLTSRRVPADERSLALAVASERGSAALGTLVLLGLCLACAGACVYGTFVRGPLQGATRLLPRASRRRCP